MNVRIFLLSTITTTLLLVSAAYAAAGSPVAHSHDGRTHSHPLPATGKNHTHGGKKKEVNGNVGNGWTSFSDSESYYIDYKDGSYDETKNKSGDVIGIIIIKTRYKNKNKTEVGKIYVTKKDCLKGYGKVVMLDLGGKFLYDISFAEGAGTASTNMASVTCQFFKEDDLKGL